MVSVSSFDEFHNTLLFDFLFGIYWFIIWHNKLTLCGCITSWCLSNESFATLDVPNDNTPVIISIYGHHYQHISKCLSMKSIWKWAVIFHSFGLYIHECFIQSASYICGYIIFMLIFHCFQVFWDSLNWWYFFLHMVFICSQMAPVLYHAYQAIILFNFYPSSIHTPI